MSIYKNMFSVKICILELPDYLFLCVHQLYKNWKKILHCKRKLHSITCPSDLLSSRHQEVDSPPTVDPNTNLSILTDDPSVERLKGCCL